MKEQVKQEVSWEILAEQQVLRYAEDLSHLQRLRHTYEQFLPAALDPEALELPAPKACEASVLFSDIRGFTTLSEQFADDPKTLLAMLNEHLAVAVDSVMRCGGTVEKFVGDGLLATFGARQTLPDHMQRAVAAGLGLIAANERLNRRLASERNFRLEVGVGVAVGRIVVGVIGPPHRAEFGILGDPVNVASRLVGLAKPAEMLLTSPAFEASRANISPEKVGRISVRGRSGALDVYRVRLGGTQHR